VTPVPPLDLVLDSTPLAVARLAADAPVPAWADGPGFVTVTRTGDELSIVAPAARVPPGVRAEGPFVGFRVRGRLDFGLVGIVASLATPLAAAGVPIFVVSTFDTDYVLVTADRAGDATAVLNSAGHRVDRASN
jgi:uncharacterized protein